MNRSDTPRFAAALATLAAAFSKEVEPGLADAYFEALEDIGAEAVLAACRQLLKTSEFFPRPIDIRRAAGQRSPAELAAEAWEVAAKLARNIRDAHHPDPVAEAAVKKLGGWRAIGVASEERLVWIRKEFLELYQDGSEGEPVREMLAAGEKTQISERAESIASKLAVGMKA